jgi:hypothetical protein
MNKINLILDKYHKRFGFFFKVSLVQPTVRFSPLLEGDTVHLVVVPV